MGIILYDFLYYVGILVFLERDGRSFTRASNVIVK